MSGHQKLLLLVTSCLVALFLFFTFTSFDSRPKVRPAPAPQACLTPLTPLASLTGLADLYTAPKCGHLATLHTLYRVEVEGSPLVVPAPLLEKLQGWLGGDQELLQEARRQKVVQVTGLLSGDTTHYNPLRARRPKPPGGQRAGREWAEEQIESTRASCDFCRAGNMTAEESWGRVNSSRCTSAANVFKVAGPSNGLILAKSHSIFDIGVKELGDLLECSQLWYKQMHKTDPGLIFPMLVWDAFPAAGASQVHPHLQTWLGRAGYSGQFSRLLREASTFSSLTGGDFWRSLTELHVALGLGVRLGTAAAIVPLTSRRDHEFLVVGPSLDSSLVSLLAAVLETYTGRLGVFCRSLAMALPPLTPQPPDISLPVVIRVGSRGDCTSAQSDVSSLDLYAFYSVNADPLKSVAALKQTLANITDR